MKNINHQTFDRNLNFFQNRSNFFNNKKIDNKCDLQGRFADILNFLYPITNSYKDKKGCQIQLWNCKEYSLVASVCDEKGNLTVISGENICNPLNPSEGNYSLLSRISRSNYSKWELAYIKETGKIFIWPKIIAAGIDDDSQIQPRMQEIAKKLDHYKEQLLERKGKAKHQSALRAAYIEKQGGRIPEAKGKLHEEKVIRAQAGMKKQIIVMKSRLGENISQYERNFILKTLSKYSALS